MAFDKSGNLYVRAFYGTVYRIDPSGNISTFASVGNGQGMAIDNTNNLFVSDIWDALIQKVNASGQVSVFPTSGLTEPAGLTFDSSGDLYAINYSDANLDPNTGSVWKFDPSGSGTEVVSGLDAPIEFAVLPIPEPASWALVALAAGAFLGSRCLRRR